MKTKTEDLFNTADTTRVRVELLKEQKGKCGITGIPTHNLDFALDHAHNEDQLVRAAVNKHANMLLGKIENMEGRFLEHWYPHGLPSFLRSCANYIELHAGKVEQRWRHPGWIKKIKTLFNKLSEKDKDQVLIALNQNKGGNLAERKLLFRNALLTKQHGYVKIKTIIKNIKEPNA